VKVCGPFANPRDEFGQSWVVAEGFGGVPEAGQFCLRGACVNFVVADLVDEDCGSAFAAAKFWHKVVPALWSVRRNRPFTERADGMWFGH